MLAVIREFAFEKLAESGEMNEIKQRHAAFYTALSEEAEPELKLLKSTEWHEKLEQEHDNLRSALKWTLDDDPEIALRIVGVIYRFWLRHGYPSEGCKWAKLALEKCGESADPTLRTKACLALGFLRMQQAEYKSANLYFEESLRLSRENSLKPMIASALGGLGSVKFLQGDLESSQILMKESLEISSEINEKRQVSIALNNLGILACEKKDYKLAHKYYEEAYTIAKKESFNLLIPGITSSMASVAFLLEDYQTSHLDFLESLKLSEELGDKRNISNAMDGIAALKVKAGELEDAARLRGAAQGIYEASGCKIESSRWDFDKVFVNEVRSAIGDEAFDAALAEGRAMRMEEAIALAREGNYAKIW